MALESSKVLQGFGKILYYEVGGFENVNQRSEEEGDTY